MERDRGFNFKLLVPPRVNKGQVSAVRPQGMGEKCDDTLHQGCSMSFDREQDVPFSNINVVTSAKPLRQDLPKIKVVPPMEKDENNCNLGQLYSELLDEVGKIKCWKVKVDSDTLQSERKLIENKRVIEKQRKAIRELQFGNESLSIKLEQEICKNEDLRNKDNATRNLCIILKDTFQRSAEKMHLFESEREETHQLVMENSKRIQKVIAEFERLCIQAEADQQEMQKVKKDLLQVEELKEKYYQKYITKVEEVLGLQTKLQNEENNIQKILLDVHVTQTHCKQLQEEKNQQYELLKGSKTQQESLLHQLRIAEQRCVETEENCKATAAALEQSKEEYSQIIQSKESSLQELSKVKNQQAEEIEQNQKTIQILQNSLALEMQRTKELEGQLMANNTKLENKNMLLKETVEQSTTKDEQIRILEDELDVKSKSIEFMKEEANVAESRVRELTAKHSKEIQQFKIKEQELEDQLFTEMKKNKEHAVHMEQLTKDITQQKAIHEELLSNFNELQSEKMALQWQVESGSSDVKAIEENMKVSEEMAQKLTTEIERLQEENQCLREEVSSIENKMQVKCEENEKLLKKTEKNKKTLRKKIAKEIAKSSELENMITSLQEESQSLKQLTKEEHQTLLKELEYKSALSTELENELKELRLTAAEATKNKEHAELKCQQRITDMVALMEKYKSRYDQMFEEKDAELNEYKKKEMQAVAQRKSLESDVSKQKTENDELRKKLETETAKGENLQKELKLLKSQESSNKQQLPTSNHKQGKYSQTQKLSTSERDAFDFSMTRKTPSYSKDGAGFMKKTVVHSGDLKSRTSSISRSKFKAYKIRTPPSTENAAQHRKRTIELDPKSDSSAQNDFLIFLNTTTPNVSAPHSNVTAFKKIQSPVTHKSPGNSLRLATLKRVRDAGWTAISDCDKKKRKNNKNIFA